MLNSKHRAKLRGIASSEQTIMQIGKGGITETVIKQVSDALTARELIKIKILENAPVFAREAAENLAKATNSEVVTVIGTKAVLYKKNEKEPKIEI